MKLNDLKPTERMSLVGGQMYSQMTKLQEFSQKPEQPNSRDVEKFLGELRDGLARIIDLIEESNRNGELQ